jgi:ribonuclease HII
MTLKTNYSEADVEIGVDEAGRGPMFGRVYIGAVVIPKNSDIDWSIVKDSKKFSSKKKILEAAEFVKAHALHWNVSWEDESTIDRINIRQATLKGMHSCIKTILNECKHATHENTMLLIDVNDFRPYMILGPECELIPINHICIKGGDNEYVAIAAASILAKVHRDEYINDLCEKYPLLSEYYSIDTNKGYGAKVHMEGIKTHGITQWHRRTFGICKIANTNDL